MLSSDLEQGHGFCDQEGLLVILRKAAGHGHAPLLRCGRCGAVSFGRYDYHAVAGSLPVGRYGGLVFENRYVFYAVRIELVYEIGGHLDPVDHPERVADLGRKHRCPRGFGFQRDPGKLTGCLSDLQQVGFATDVGDGEY